MKDELMLKQRLREARIADKGFTLIELLIVIVVLGILAGIVVFGVATFRAGGVGVEQRLGAPLPQAQPQLHATGAE
jgi:prepilin-type N-terminal cleavage/methylation domain-containing protein